MQNTLSPRELSEAIGVSESSLKRWADDGRIRVARTAGGHRRIALTDAVHFIRESGLPLVRPDILGLHELYHAPPVSDAPDDMVAVLFDALRGGRAAEARGTVLSLYLNGHGVAAICDELITPAMARIGELWRHDAEGIFVEHRATDLCIASVHQLRAMLPAPAANAPVALGGAPADDPYILPSLMAATVLASFGWHEINLGPDTPVDALIAAAEREEPALIWLAVSAEQAGMTLDRYVDEVGDWLADRNSSLVIGGRGRPGLPDLSHRGIFQASSMRELEAFARGALATARGGRADTH